MHYSEGNRAPVVLVTMIHILCRPVPLPQASAPATIASLEYLEREGLIRKELRTVGYGMAPQGSGWRATPKGREYVENLLRVEPPEAAMCWAPTVSLPPDEPGWYPCAHHPDRECLRWWNGEYWSAAARPHMTAEEAAAQAAIRTEFPARMLRWADPWWGTPEKVAQVFGLGLRGIL